jgi:hypothetical protein
MAKQSSRNTPTFIEVQKHLSGIHYPAEKADLIGTARDHEAPDDIIELLESLEERTYESPAEVSKAVARAD